MENLELAVAAIEKHRPRRIVALTGAGISAESGIPTFRGACGLWENHRAEELATPEAFRRDALLVWRWYEWRRELIREAQPNAAHLALARLEHAAGLESLIVTQNVDGLHRRGGAGKIIEIHGNIMEARCTKEHRVLDLYAPQTELPPRCDCGAILRPNVVWFGEQLPPGAWERAADAVAQADLVLVIGTSGVVYPAAGLIGYLDQGISIEINPEATPLSSNCTFAIAATAGSVTPLIVDALIRSAR
jgi:NAD-dependent deacetylase